LTTSNLPDNLAAVQMLPALERLLILQDRDRRITRVRSELGNIDFERQAMRSRAHTSQARLEEAKHKSKQIESERKRLELEVETKKQQIEKYSLQQYQTKKNDEYRALAHEIEMARETIVKLEDEQLEWMEKADAVARDVAAANRVHDEARALAERQVAELGTREENLRKELVELESNRSELVEEGVLQRYERLRRTKGETVVVGVNHGVCGGCHMRLPTQVIITAQGDQEIAACSNCGRILYYTRDMDLAAAE
jgi:predicted  nucleic acid-binding Zn-ribbon protein